MLLAIAAGPAWAQSDVTLARISGTVKDEQGQPLPGAMVEAKSKKTGLVFRATTDVNGFYRLLNLPSGVYQLTAALTGFATLEQEIRLVLGAAPTVDFALPLATAAEAITDTAGVPLVEATNTSVGARVLNEQIKCLPLNGRDFTSPIFLTPESRRESQRGYISLSGQRGINDECECGRRGLQQLTGPRRSLVTPAVVLSTSSPRAEPMAVRVLEGKFVFPPKEADNSSPSFTPRLHLPQVKSWRGRELPGQDPAR